MRWTELSMCWIAVPPLSIHSVELFLCFPGLLQWATLWPLVLCYGVSLTWTVATSEPRALQQSRAEDRTGDETRRDESVGGSWRDESSPNRWSPFGSEAVQGVLARPFRVASLAALSLAFLSALRWPPLINDAMPWLMALLKRFMR